MKKCVLDFCINSIKKNCDNKYNDEKIAEIRYGLEAIYLTFTKMIIIFIVAILLNIFKEMLIVLLLYNILRITGFGIHAKKSWMCLVSSLILFIGSPLLAMNIIVPIFVKIILCTLCVIAYFLYSPADTEKHPLVHSNKRALYRKITVFNSLIYTFICIYTKNIFLSNAILCALLIEVGMILPISYNYLKFHEFFFYNIHYFHKL